MSEDDRRGEPARQCCAVDTARAPSRDTDRGGASSSTSHYTRQAARAALALALALAMPLGACSSEAGSRRIGGASSAKSMKELAAEAALLPPYLHAPLALDSVLSDRYLSASTTVHCTSHDSTGHELRRTIRGQLEDHSGLVVFVRAAARDSALRRVEVVRRPPDDAQMGFIWDASTDTTEIVTYPTRGSTMGRRTWYAGGAVAARMQQLGRRMVALRCGKGSG